MRHVLKTTTLLAALALPFVMANPVFAQEMESKPGMTEDMAGHHRMMGKGKHHGQGSMCECPMMMKEGGMMMGPDHEGMGMMKPKGPETPDMKQLRLEMKEQHKKLEADRAQMRADCERMHELHQRMMELRQKMRPRNTSPTKGNAAPKNPAMDEMPAPRSGTE